MNNLTNIRLELDINAQKMMQQVQIHNQHLEENIKSGIELALKEIFEENDFERVIADLVKQEIKNQVKDAASSWAVRHKIQDAISSAIEKKVDSIAESWAEKMTKNLI